jgi:hypothetical protein
MKTRFYAAVLCLPIILCAVSCLQSPEASELTSASAGNDAEPIGEAEQEWTKSDCYSAWQYNVQGCNTSPPNLRPACWAAAAALLGACLATAE